MKKSFIIILLLSLLSAQPDSRFDTFDWVSYHQLGNINSITEGFNHVYFATQNAGLIRYNIYQDKFDYPITTAQGLTENQILAVHFDKSSGILWSATKEHINYSYNAEGNWFNKSFHDIGLGMNNRIRQIGSSNSYIWLNAGSVYIKLDKVSAIFHGTYPFPNETDIVWSSIKNNIFEIPAHILNYTLMDGWLINSTEFLDPFGTEIRLTTYFQDDFGKIYLGLEDGTILIGNSLTEVLYPYNYGLNLLGVNELTDDEVMWLVGGFNSNGKSGLTQFNINTNEFYHVDLINEINLNPMQFYSVTETDDEVWFGGNSIISIYNKNNDYWKEIGEERGIPSGKITSMVNGESSIWIGTRRGLVELSKNNKHSIESELENLFRIEKINDIELVNNQLWIATDRELIIFDKNQNKLIDFKLFGTTDDVGKRINIFNKFTDIFKNGKQIYISTSLGILNYNIVNESWRVALEPSTYKGSMVNKLAVSEGMCFLGTNNGIWQIDLNDGYSQLFDYKFIGSVNDLFINKDILYIGSDSGFIKYFWKNNL